MEHSGSPITIQEWMGYPIRFEYLAMAVDLAWMLTKRLSEMVAAEELKMQDIAAENVRIILEIKNFIPSIKEVRFELSEPDLSPCYAENNAPLRPRAVCAALGGILLEIFSMGQSSSLAERPISTKNHNSPVQPNNDDDDESLPPTAKRMLAVATSDSKSARAKNLLLYSGMPLSVCQLVCDLIDAVDDEPSLDSTPITTLDEALCDLTKMKDDPQRFLFGRTCPEKALEDTGLFDKADEQLFGRGEEVEALMATKNGILVHVNAGRENETGGVHGSNFLGEVAFLSGYAGSGKSSILRSLIRSCKEENRWFILKCKFDKQAVPLMVMAKAFNDFFGEYGQTTEDNRSHIDPTMMISFTAACRSLFSTIDCEGFGQLCEIIPNLARVFPHLAATSSRGKDHETSSQDKVGCADKRRIYSIHLLFGALCSVGCPVIFALDDLQWSDSFVMEWMKDFFVSYIHNTSSPVKERGGLMVVGTFRSNEADEHLVEPIKLMERSEAVNVSRLDVGELSTDDVTQLISAKLCLPMRLVRELGELVHRKTRGMAFFVMQFLKTIVRNEMLSFSLEGRRWTWDCDIIDMQMISEGVAELLTTTFNRLPLDLMWSLKIASCFGSQITERTVELMNTGQKVLSCDMQKELQLAVKEGFLEKAGPIYQFTHDLIQQTVYELIPANNRKMLHKIIGKSLLRFAGVDETILLLAVDQIKIFCDGGILSPEERSDFARANATAAKFALSISSFEQARSYIDTGIKLLDTDHWDKQYLLSLSLFEMSASVSCMHGDVATMTTRLDEILSHAKSFDDSLNASAMRAKLMASSSNHDGARANCLAILSSLGEDFPQQDDLPLVLSKLSAIKPLLSNITVERVKLIPRMTDKTKLNAMKFLSILCTHCVMSRPMLLPLLSCRMVELMLHHGFCDEANVGLIMTSHGMFLFTDDIQEAVRIGKVGEYLREESPNKHRLKSMSCHQWEMNMKFLGEPAQVLVATYPSLYKSAIFVGDVESAMRCRFSFCSISLYLGEDLTTLSKHFVLCLKQSGNYQQQAIRLVTMAVFRSVVRLSGKAGGNEMKSYEELEQISKQSNNPLLSWVVFSSQLCEAFWFRDYNSVVHLCEKHPPSAYKRVLGIFRCFFEGIAALNLARHKNQVNYRIIGEEAVKNMAKLELINEWNFENKSKLLQSELHYLNGDLDSADATYKASILSARKHRLIHEEALACELYGIFCLENQMIEKGDELLNIALENYKQWGAMKKAEELQEFVEAQCLH